MWSRNPPTTLVAGTVLLSLFSPLSADSKGPFEDLPSGWVLQRSFTAPADQAAAIGKRLGGDVTRLSNTFLTVNGQRLQVNILDCRTDRDAEGIRETILKTKPNPAFCVKSASRVIEFMCRDIRLARKAHYVLGFRAPERTYRISFDLAAVEKADYMAANKLFNLMLAMKQTPDSPEVRTQIAALSKRFRFGNTIKLRCCGVAKAKSKYSLAPKPTKVDPLAGGDVVQYSFKKLPSRAGIPYVSVAATVQMRAFAFVPADRKDIRELLAPTSFWPSSDPEVIALAQKITRGKTTSEGRADAILEWLMPGKNIRFGGPVTGSRYGVKQTLKQGFGQCWDFSDCFVTLCRAAGVPCRQVGGWLHEECGHIWAEVLINGKGWQQVDPTAGMACGSDYIPYLTTEDGEMPNVYLAMPKIEVLKEE